MKYLILIYILLSPLALAQTKIGCTQKNICTHFERFIKSQNIQGLEIVKLPDVELAKGLPYLITAPHDLMQENWDVIQSREKDNKRTLRIFLSSKYTKFYKRLGSTPVTELAHYWNFPTLQCDVENQFAGLLAQAVQIKMPTHDCAKLEQSMVALLYQLKEKKVDKIIVPTKELTLFFPHTVFNNQLEKDKFEFYQGDKLYFKLDTNNEMYYGMDILTKIKGKLE